ncbi:MAG TPA: DUF2239 family protein [Polyangiaceae bacterium]|nr:DUF2239 family protein [Polyangiaceae bacterium]
MISRAQTYSAFAGDRLIAFGALPEVLSAAKAHVDSSEDPQLLIFEDRTGRQLDFDFRGSLDEVLAHALPPRERTGPGRPKLGVVSREVSLLPRHWEWLEAQPQGISAGLRRLVEEARKKDPQEQRARKGREALSKFMTAIAGNRPNYEEATRALFASDHTRFEELIAEWPEDIRAHLLRVLEDSLTPSDELDD